MARVNKRKKEQFERYKKAYGKLTNQELESLWEYDEKYCNSDEDAQDYLRNHLVTEYIEEKAISESFYKAPKPKAEVSKTELRKNTAQAKETQAQRMNYMLESLKKYSFLFGDLVERTNTELKYIDNETGLPITVKFSRHKIQKVVTKNIKRKTVKLEDGTEEPTPFTTIELRCMAVETIILGNPTLFEAPSLAGSQFGYACRDIKYPFGSVKVTHHKK